MSLTCVGVALLELDGDRLDEGEAVAHLHHVGRARREGAHVDLVGVRVRARARVGFGFGFGFGVKGRM